MTLARVKTWASEVLTATDLNAEFNNILNFLNASPIIATDALTKAEGDILQYRSGAWANRTVVQASADLTPNGYISGLTLSAAGSTGTFGIAVGLAGDSTGVIGMLLASAFTKTTSAWAVGTGNGAMDTGAVAINTWYHVFLIKRSDTGLVDVLFSLSATGPTMPASYTYKRRIGAMKTDASSKWLAFLQVGDHFVWATPIKDLDSGAVVASGGYTLNLTGVPTGVNVVARLRGFYTNATVGSLFLISSPLELAATPNAIRGNLTAAVQVTGAASCFTCDVVTDSTATIRYSVNQNSSDIALDAYGWIDSRGKG